MSVTIKDSEWYGTASEVSQRSGQRPDSNSHVRFRAQMIVPVSAICSVFLSCFIVRPWHEVAQLRSFASVIFPSHNLLYHLIQFGSHASRGLPNRRHVGHGNFCTVPKLFGGQAPNIKKVVACGAKLPKTSDMSRQVWDVAETKTSSDASRVTWSAELSFLKWYSIPGYRQMSNHSSRPVLGSDRHLVY